MNRKPTHAVERQLTRSWGALLGLRIVATGLLLGVEILLARVLGRSLYGEYAISVSLMTVVGTICFVGLPSTMLKLVPVESAHGRVRSAAGVMRRAGRVMVGLSLGAAVLLLLGFRPVARVLDITDAEALIGVACLVPLFTLNAHRQAALRALKRPVLALFPEQVVRPLVLGVTVLVLAGVTKSVTPESAVWCLVGALAVAAVTGQINLKRVGAGMLRARPDDLPAVPLRNVALPLAGISVMSLFVVRVDPLLLGWLAGSEQASDYAAASRLALLLTFGLIAVNQSIAPFLAELHAKGELARMQSILSKAAGVLAVFTIPLALGMFLFGSTALGLFGDDFSGGTRPLFWLLGAQTLNACAGSVGVLLSMTGNQKAAMWSMLGAVLTKIALTCALVPAYGAEGAAIATLFMFAVQNGVQYSIVRKRLRLDPTILSIFGGPSMARPGGA